MKEVKVYIKDKNTLVLLENANEGDYINLSSLNKVDLSNIEEEILKGKDSVYEKRILDLKSQIEREYELKLKQEKESKISEIQNLKLTLSNEKEKEISIIKSSKELEIERLKSQINNLNNLMSLNLEKEKLQIKEQYSNEINKLKQEIELTKSLKEQELLKQEIEYNNKLKEKDDTINLLQRQKTLLHTKQTGEDLESWCNNEVKAYMQNGLLNCTWDKDNTVVKNEDEQKGSKADYIFKVYVDDNHNEDELLTSVCLEMKDENPDSVNKKTNADHYKQLDKNRIKKNCKYALLVSNLELDKPNDLPIYRVNEYKDMYVVRPAYMMTFLNLITSLTNRFKELIENDKESKIELKNVQDLMGEFDKLKTTYLDNPLESLRKQVESIRKSNEAIFKASKNIDDSIDAITRNYISVIESKLSNFEIKVNRAYKKNK